MSILERLKNLAKITDESYFDETEEPVDYPYETDDGQSGDIYGDEPVAPQPEAFERKHVQYQPADQGGASRVVDIRSGSRSQIVFKKLNEFEAVRDVADVLNEKKIVVLNLETCPADITRRALDFLCGVAYANSGSITRVAVKTYIITPYNVPVTGEILDQVENGAAK